MLFATAPLDHDERYRLLCRERRWCSDKNEASGLLVRHPATQRPRRWIYDYLFLYRGRSNVCQATPLLQVKISLILKA
jgi:hypothetical protein